MFRGNREPKVNITATVNSGHDIVFTAKPNALNELHSENQALNSDIEKYRNITLPNIKFELEKELIKYKNDEVDNKTRALIQSINDTHETKSLLLNSPEIQSIYNSAKALATEAENLQTENTLNLDDKAILAISLEYAHIAMTYPESEIIPKLEALKSHLNNHHSSLLNTPLIPKIIGGLLIALTIALVTLSFATAGIFVPTLLAAVPFLTKIAMIGAAGVAGTALGVSGGLVLAKNEGGFSKATTNLFAATKAYQNKEERTNLELSDNSLAYPTHFTG